jgi:hypothetical protein
MVKTYIEYYCDLCCKRMDYPRFIHLKTKRFNINCWGVNYDVCEECFDKVGKYIRSIDKTMEGVINGKET